MRIRIAVSGGPFMFLAMDMPMDLMPRADLLMFEEIVTLAGIMVSLGVGKIRLTGGEPLLRRGLEDLVAMLAVVEGVKDIAMTTNGVLLAHHAEDLALAGLNRVTMSLDALDPEIFAKMNGVGAKVDRVLTGVKLCPSLRAYGESERGDPAGLK